METITTAALDAGARLLDAIAAQDFAAAKECYRLRGRDPEAGWTLVEQTGYLSAPDGKIALLNLVCSGQRPVE